MYGQRMEGVEGKGDGVFMGEVACQPNFEGWVGLGPLKMAEGIPGRGNSLRKVIEAGMGGACTRRSERYGLASWEGCRLAPCGPHPALRRVLSGPPALACTESLKKVQSTSRARK